MEKINAVRKITKDDEERIAKSAFPTDKPIMIEGNFLTSKWNYSYTTYAVKEIKIDKNEARVLIDFVNLTTTPEIKWSDTAILVNENGWKVDDVLYAPEDSEPKSLIESLDLVIKDAKNSKKEK